MEYRYKDSTIAERCQQSITEKQEFDPMPSLCWKVEPYLVLPVERLRKETLHRFLTQTDPAQEVNTFLIAGALSRSALGYLKLRR